MNLKEYIQKNQTDRNIFWILSSGEHQNLLDEAIEKMEDYRKKLKREKQKNRKLWKKLKGYDEKEKQS